MKKDDVHPSYGMIGVSRVSGNTGPLFGSSLDNHFTSFRIRIFHGVRNTTMSEESFYGVSNRLPIIEIELSAVQFMEFITNSNIGDGVPCTIRRLGLEKVPEPPLQDLERNRIKNNFKDRVGSLFSKLAGIEESLKTLLKKKTITKTDKVEIADSVSAVRREVESNLPYMMEIFDEATNDSISAARIEVDAFVTTTLTRLGLERVQLELLGGSSDPKSLK
jgi:hypothetical protein